MISPESIALPEIPVHKTVNGKFDATAFLWDPSPKSQPGKVIYDPEVQRVFRPLHAKKIANEWNISLANPVHLSVRDDTTEVIIDGLHTTWAAKENGVKALACIRHYTLSIAQEAAFHIKVQSDRKADSAADKWNLKIVAKVPEYVAAQRMLSQYGLGVGNQIRAAGAVIYVIENFGTKAMEQSVITMNAWCGGAAKREDWTANAVIRALGYLFGHHPLVADPVQLGRKLRKKTDPVGLGGQIAAQAKGGGGSGSRTIVGAKMIADIWNIRRAPANQFPMGVMGVVPTVDDEDDEDEDE